MGHKNDLVYMFALGRFNMDLTTSYIYHLILQLKSIVFSDVEIPSHAGHCPINLVNVW